MKVEKMNAQIEIRYNEDDHRWEVRGKARTDDLLEHALTAHGNTYAAVVIRAAAWMETLVDI